MKVVMLKKISSSAKKAWLGEEKLWVVFWGWFIALLISMWITRLSDPVTHILLFLPPSLIYYNSILIVDETFTILIRSFLIVGLWRCARNTNNKAWFYLTRMFTVLFLIATLLGRIWAVSDMISMNKEVRRLMQYQGLTLGV